MNVISKVLAAALILWTSEAWAEPVSIEYGGKRLNGDFSAAEGDPTAGAAVLLVHGTGAHHKMETISGVQQALVQQGFAVLSITLSLGVSNRSGMMNCDVVQNHVQGDGFGEIDAWLGFLRRSGSQRIILMGHSRGGRRVARYAVEKAAKGIDRIVLLAPATWNEMRAKTRFKERFNRDLDELIKTARAAKPNALLEGVPFMYCAQTNVMAGSFLSYHAPDGRRDTPVLLKAIDLPVLVIAASEDAVVPDLADRMKQVNLDHVSASEVDGADHFFLDFFADDVAEAVQAFAGGGG